MITIAVSPWVTVVALTDVVSALLLGLVLTALNVSSVLFLKFSLRVLIESQNVAPMTALLTVTVIPLLSLARAKNSGLVIIAVSPEKIKFWNSI